MPACANPSDRGSQPRITVVGHGPVALVLLGSLLLAACQQSQQSFGFEIRQVEVRPGPAATIVRIEQDLQLSNQAREALDRGVPLVLNLRARIRTTDGKALGQSRYFRLSYSPLSDHYQLESFGPESSSSPSSGPESVHTFPRLRHALAKLSTSEFQFSAASHPAMVEVRSRLDNSKLPPPMRLPAWFSRQWRHDSGWWTQAISESPAT